MPKKLTAIDLFSGCGGLTTGLKWAGYDVIGAVEIDKKARETYSLNHPEIPFLGDDVRHITLSVINSKIDLNVGELDLLSGCPPCQGFSKLRNKNGGISISDDRNNLIDDFLRLIFELKPKLIMLENVTGLAMYKKFENLIHELKHNGYFVIFENIDVSSYGIPQRRKRLILIASRVGQVSLANPSVDKKKTVRETIGFLPDVGFSGDLLHDLDSLKKIKRSNKINSLIKLIPKDGGSRSSLPENLILACHKKISGFHDVYGRMRWDDVAPTITSGCSNPSKGRFLHPFFDRPITLREAALLQGFPFDYKFDISHGKQSISTMIGNAIPPYVAFIHSKNIGKELYDNR